MVHTHVSYDLLCAKVKSFWRWLWFFQFPVALKSTWFLRQPSSFALFIKLIFGCHSVLCILRVKVLQGHIPAKYAPVLAATMYLHTWKTHSFWSFCTRISLMRVNQRGRQRLNCWSYPTWRDQFKSRLSLLQHSSTRQKLQRTLASTALHTFWSHLALSAFYWLIWAANHAFECLQNHSVSVNLLAK